MRSTIKQWSILFAVFVLAAAVPLVYNGEYFYFAAYSVLQLMLMATAWNILGGLAGYVNFGSAAFFAIGAYSSVVLVQAWDAPLAVCIAVGTLVAGLTGTGLGYLTLRLKGVYFAIVTLALAVMLFTLVVNWDYVGGSRGAYVVLSGPPPFGLKQWVQLLYIIMTALALVGIGVARQIQYSKLGKGLVALRDDELAAEGVGVPTLRLKLIATSISGALMGAAGTTFPHFMSYLEPTAAFSLTLSINSLAVPLIGGMHSWFGPVIGALLLGSLLQISTVTWSSELNLVVVGVVLLLFVTLAPQGIVGLWEQITVSRKEKVK
ncbi:Branched-chain amino acid transport system permease protein OS=Castellaniella defragrans OX=75697 GN=HNR28_003054 PE=4 SV=1 [Castellaniella defragrans]